MLHTLRIRNLAILPEAELEFESGFTALTGETGAGKSILLGALKLVFGGKAKSDLIRQGEEKLRVEAVFDLPPSPELRALLREREIDAEDELILERELTASGKSRARVNGTLVPLADLEAVGRHLVDLHGQHEQQGLLDAGTHGAYLDGHAGLTAEAADFARAWRAWRDSEQELRKVTDEAARLREQIEFLQFQFKELDKAGLGKSGAGEEEKIEADLKMLSAFEKISGGRDSGLDALEGSSGIFPSLGKLQREIQALGKLLGREAVAAHEEKLEAARALLDEVRGALRGLDVPAEADPERLDALNARLALFQRLKAKHKTDLAGLIALRDRRRAEIDAVENAGVGTDALRATRDLDRKAALARATALSGRRKAAAKKFDAEVNARLSRLGMEGSRFETRLEALPELSPTGLDRIEFFLAANPGEPPRALRLSASGGEISRVMLAVKGALAQTDPRPLLVFDELDTGIGGQTALRVGEALAELAGHHQLLVITHLHQVAARAAQQHKVEKRLEGGRTVTGVAPLAEKERATELARMMGGESEAALKHAREMLRK